MKLIAEQVHYLRERKEELESRFRDYQAYCRSRESVCLEGIGAPHYVDFQTEVEHSQAIKEQERIDTMLGNADFVRERNFEVIDIGTGFYTDFGDGELDRTILTDGETALVAGVGVFASTESDFGKAVYGHKAGDEVSYTVKATGRKIKATIKEIDTVKSNYMKFLKDTPLIDRMSSKAKKELQELKKNDIDEYNKRHQISSSQARLLEDDLRRTTTQNKGQLKAFYNSLEVTYPNDDDTIQVGSIVDLYLQDGDNEPTKHHFEFINRAVSTEIDADYVERISTLGTAIYGLKAGDTFSVRRKNMPSLKGVIDSVDNKKDVVRRVR